MFCIFQNHVAIGRTVAILQETIGEELRTQDILKAYLMFECLTDHSYSFNCVLCGHYPSVMIMDGVRKTCFRFAGL